MYVATVHASWNAVHSGCLKYLTACYPGGDHLRQAKAEGAEGQATAEEGLTAGLLQAAIC